MRLRTVLRDYRRALTDAASDPRRLRARCDPRAHDARRARTPAPSTTARLDLPALERLSQRRGEAAAKLVQAARLGEFRFGPNDSPWYGVSFASTEQARAMHALAGRLHRQDVPALLERGYALIAQTRMRPFATIDELGEYLRLLQGIRDSLDRFSPTVFERPLGELIQALGARRDAPAMSGTNRRRLRRLAKEYVRPGVHVPDMHEALVRIQQQRTSWQRFVEAGVAPEVPLGLADVHVAWQRVEADLGELDRPLGRERAGRLASLPVAQLVRTLAGLAAESKVFDNLVERATLRGELARLGRRAPALRALGAARAREPRGGRARVRVVAVGARAPAAERPGAARREHVGRRPARARLPARR